MPQVTKNAPDLVDVLNLHQSLGEDYQVVVYYSTRIRGDIVEVIGKTYGAPYTLEAPVEHVALVSYPVSRPRDMATIFYTISFDLWCQHEGAGATAAKRGPTYDWRGRVEVPRRRMHR